MSESSDNNNFNSNNYPSSMLIQDIDNISSIYNKKNSFILSDYHFLSKKCSKCSKYIEINSISKEKITIVCSCKDCNKEIYFTNLWENLMELNVEENANEKLKCKIHKKELMYYCKKCEEHFCIECPDECLRNNHEILELKLDIQSIKKIKYIEKKIKDNKNIDISNKYNSFSLESNNIILQNNNKKEDNINLKKNNNIYINNSKEIINNNDGNFSFNSLEKDNNFGYFDFCSIIIKDFYDYPNYFNINNIHFIENFITYYYDKYNEIKLKYTFNKEILNNNYNIKLFGEKFVNNNKDNCFLVINGNIINLTKKINLKDFFEERYFDKPSNIFEVSLIIRNDRMMTDLSNMFYKVSSIDFSTDFSKFNISNIKNTSYMFYNCKSFFPFQIFQNGILLILEI